MGQLTQDIRQYFSFSHPRIQTQETQTGQFDTTKSTSPSPPIQSTSALTN